uniref:VPS13_mid_rpt domain-containing protein n=1 Tax=Ascaris lumbricoides TaxID=6252 RepID=A0A0M3ITH0_ASCLU
NFANVEVGVEYLWVRRGASFESASPFSFERHVWGTAVVMGAALAQFSRTPKQKLLQMQLDECHCEYEDELAQQIASFVCAVLPSEAPSANRTDSWSDVVTPSPRQSAEFVVQISAKKLFSRTPKQKLLQMQLDECHCEYEDELAQQIASFVCAVLPSEAPSANRTDSWSDVVTPSPRQSAEFVVQISAKKLCGEGGRLIARSSTAPNSLNLVLLADAPVTLVWDPVVHIVFLETYR